MTERIDEELAMLADVRRFLRSKEGADFTIPTTALDQVLDERGASASRQLDEQMLTLVEQPVR
ncbi:hypothetical protein [Rhodococcus sp. ARC_M6]|uniref:hypothetical protein n=1 Tax=Rhodococcus sp. ARC_M6 TaxID=2928852 RepID=UPI001FB3124B|nr:hypothetical protein [Rhodococcus sp. ARC_M6]MCJ0907111.1 hypothetical protein [Rhodococcus sp. ARC_M6]